MNDVIGFGEGSATHATTTRNAFVRMTTTPVDGGAEVVLEALGKRRFDSRVRMTSDGGKCMLRLGGGTDEMA